MVGGIEKNPKFNLENSNAISFPDIKNPTPIQFIKVKELLSETKNNQSSSNSNLAKLMNLFRTDSSLIAKYLNQATSDQEAFDFIKLLAVNLRGKEALKALAIFNKKFPNSKYVFKSLNMQLEMMVQMRDKVSLSKINDKYQEIARVFIKFFNSSKFSMNEVENFTNEVIDIFYKNNIQKSSKTIEKSIDQDIVEALILMKPSTPEYSFKAATILSHFDRKKSCWFI